MAAGSDLTNSACPPTLQASSVAYLAENIDTIIHDLNELNASTPYAMGVSVRPVLGTIEIEDIASPGSHVYVDREAFFKANPSLLGGPVHVTTHFNQHMEDNCNWSKRNN